MITVGEAVIRCLEKEGVELVFGYPGGAVLPVYDALHDAKIKHVLVRNEQGAVHAANGYARATGRVGVCVATSGPGATNLVTGIATAYMDSVPIVLITGQVPTVQVGTDAFQEVDITGITMPITKHNFLVKDPAVVPVVIKKAFHLARTGRPGPVLIDLPRDVTAAEIEFEYPEQVQLKGYKPTFKGHPSQIAQAAKMIYESTRPVILTGGGVISSGAAPELLKLAEIISAPVASTLMGLGGFPGDHKLSLGMAGLHGTRYANMAITNSDLLIGLGVRFADRVTGTVGKFAPKARVIHVDVDPAEIGKNVQPHLPIVGDVKQVLLTLLPLLSPREGGDWLAEVAGYKRDYPLEYTRENGLKPQYVIEKLSGVTRGEGIVVTDVGQHQMWVAQYFCFKYPRTLVTSGGLGCMGYGLPAAIGAKFGRPEKQVILVSGDGSFQMMMTELGTLAEQGLTLKIFILNNKRLGMVRQLQEFYYDKRYSAVDFSFSPDFAALAGIYGLSGYTVDTGAAFDAVVEEVLAGEGPALVNCLVEPEENVFPMVLAGKGLDEAID
ncbi:MAG: biosynthetic-type acetolactate synthase large subunit [Ammonifex sp.]|jgi:acetolactate synthase-1/2/3 large subunit|nr:MAG: biosynthetic-type acetolactate synthase large subunit [Ammonifex sp.]